MDGIEALLADVPEASAYYAVCELDQGRIEWLCEHIRRCNFQISPMVARKLLSLLDPSENDTMHELAVVRRRGVAPAMKDPWAQRILDLEMAVEVARIGGFKRAGRAGACHAVGARHGLSGATVERRVRPLKIEAFNILEEEKLGDAYSKGEVDYLGRALRALVSGEG